MRYWHVAALLLVGLEALPIDARAAVLTCVAGGTPAAPRSYHDPGTWTPAEVPGDDDEVRLAAACAVRCEGECRARTLVVTNALASFEVTAGGSLILSGCDEGAAQNPATTQCGALNGSRFALQGALLHDSAIGGAAFVRGALVPGHPEQMRLILDAAIAVEPGDWLQIRGGPRRGHVHRVVAADTSTCPSATGCWVDVALHDPDMDFGRDVQTQGYAIDLGSYAADAVRIAGADVADGELSDPRHCVELCTARVAGECVAADAIARDHSYVGWYAQLGAGALEPADPARPRLLVVESQNDVGAAFGEGTVDRVCFAEPLPAALIPTNGSVDVGAAFWPGFAPGDAWALFRPATVRYDGDEGDGGIGFHASCLDADFAYFDNWARVALRDGTPACQEPIQDSVVTSWQEGLPPKIVQQSNSCNAHSLTISEYPALRGDRVAIVDTRTPVDTSTTCDTGAGPADPAPDSGHHGVSLTYVVFDPDDPPADWLIRHAADDGVVIRTNENGPGTWHFPGWSFWYMASGRSGEVIGFVHSAPGQTVRVTDAQVVMWTGNLGCGGAFNDPDGNIRFELDGVAYLDPHHAGPVIGLGKVGEHDVRDLLAWGGASATCAAMQSGSIRDSWLSGWNRLFRQQGGDVERVRLAALGGVPGGAILGGLLSPEVVIENFVFTGLGNAALLPTCSTSCAIDVGNGFAEWRAPGTSMGLISFSANPLVQFEDRVESLLLQRRKLLRCNAAGGETGENIGPNALLDAPAGAPIEGLAGCPSATAPLSIASPTPGTVGPFHWWQDGFRYGPGDRVGMRADSAVPARFELENTFFIPAPEIELAECENGIDDDGDGAIDGADAGCASASDLSERDPTLPCDDGVDNDGDGVSDYPGDPACMNATFAREHAQCQDGLDNDHASDGIDFDGGASRNGGVPLAQPDPDCRGVAWDDREARSASCGLGVELIVVLAVLRSARRRNRCSAPTR